MRFSIGKKLRGCPSIFYYTLIHILRALPDKMMMGILKIVERKKRALSQGNFYENELLFRRLYFRQINGLPLV